MTYEQLEQKLGPLTRSEWRQASGGGWIQNTATVANEANVQGDSCVSGNAHVRGDACVSGNARVFGNAHVYDNASVSGNACVSGNARVYDNARVFGGACVSGNARVFGDARVSGNACVSGNARVFGNAHVSGGARVSGGKWEVSPLYVADPRGHGATNSKPGFLKIGCEEHSFSDWRERFPAIARKHSLTPSEVQFYGGLVDFFASFGK